MAAGRETAFGVKKGDDHGQAGVKERLPHTEDLCVHSVRSPLAWEVAVVRMPIDQLCLPVPRAGPTEAKSAACGRGRGWAWPSQREAWHPPCGFRGEPSVRLRAGRGPGSLRGGPAGGTHEAVSQRAEGTGPRAWGCQGQRAVSLQEWPGPGQLGLGSSIHVRSAGTHVSLWSPREVRGHAKADPRNGLDCSGVLSAPSLGVWKQGVHLVERNITGTGASTLVTFHLCSMNGPQRPLRRCCRRPVKAVLFGLFLYRTEV